MSHRKTVQMELIRSGFQLIRHGKHFVYRNNTNETVIVPNHNKMNELTYRGIMKKIGRVSK